MASSGLKSQDPVAWESKWGARLKLLILMPFSSIYWSSTKRPCKPYSHLLWISEKQKRCQTAALEPFGEAKPRFARCQRSHCWRNWRTGSSHRKKRRAIVFGRVPLGRIPPTNIRENSYDMKGNSINRTNRLCGDDSNTSRGQTGCCRTIRAREKGNTANRKPKWCGYHLVLLSQLKHLHNHERIIPFLLDLRTTLLDPLVLTEYDSWRWFGVKAEFTDKSEGWEIMFRIGFCFGR